MTRDNHRGNEDEDETVFVRLSSVNIAAIPRETCPCCCCCCFGGRGMNSVGQRTGAFEVLICGGFVCGDLLWFTCCFVWDLWGSLSLSLLHMCLFYLFFLFECLPARPFSLFSRMHSHHKTISTHAL